MSKLFFFFAGVCFLSLVYMNFHKIFGFLFRMLGRVSTSQGNIFVTGEGEIEIELPGGGILYDIQVGFAKETYLPPPCDPNNIDEMEWSIHQSGHSPRSAHRLKIHWKVSNIREIDWVARYYT